MCPSIPHREQVMSMNGQCYVCGCSLLPQQWHSLGPSSTVGQLVSGHNIHLPLDMFASLPGSCSPCRIHGKSALVNITVDSNGRKKVNGKPKSLKRSGEYPLQFGLALAALLHPTGEPEQSPEKGYCMLLFISLFFFLFG